MDVAGAIGEQPGGPDASIGNAGEATGMNRATDCKSQNEAKALVVVRRHTSLSFPGGTMPFSSLDLLAMSSAQLTMVADIASIYGVPFQCDKVALVISALLGSVVPQGRAVGVAGMAIKSIPADGSLAGMALMPTFPASFAYALGRVLIDHFEAGSTLLDLDPTRLAACFTSQFQSHSATAAETLAVPEPAPSASPGS
jgi:uncharacterized protein (DUF697 family)